MKAERWQQINDLFQSATERAPEERAAFLDEACHGDKGLCREVESLIASYERAEKFIETPAFEVSPELLLDDADALIGQQLGHYRIESVLGIGGMGEVYLARDTTLERKVALKLLPRQFTQDRDRLRRFAQEARAASALNHPNIITIHEIGEWNGAPFIATEYIEGQTLRDYIEKPDRPLSEILEIGVQIAAALAAAHTAGIIHRDIKPANIMLRQDGYIKVLDFGLAKLATTSAPREVTDPGRVMGTVNYMSPEQALGQPVDHRTDIFSLGAILYEMATGHRAFEGDSDAAVYDGILNKAPPPLAEFGAQLPTELDQVIRRALEKDREHRYQAATDLRADLKLLMQRNGSTALMATRPHRSARSWLTWRNAALAALLIGTLSGLWLWQGPNKLFHTGKKSIAVLPFENLSADGEDAFFADAVHDEILTNLAKVADLKVISRTSVMGFRGKQRNLREIANALHVSYVVEGTAQRAAGRVRVMAQLIDARNDVHLWAEKYDREVADIFSIQSDIAQAIANQLQARLTSRERKAFVDRPTNNSAAYEAYLRGLVAGAESSAAGRTKAARFFNEAVELDRNFALAWARLGIANTVLYYRGLDRTPQRLARAQEAVEMALELQPELEEAQWAQGYYYFRGQGDYTAAHAAFEKTRALFPNDSRILQDMSSVASTLGNYQEAVSLQQQAIELDPRNPDRLFGLGWVYLEQRQFSEARAMLDRALALEPDNARFIVTKAATYQAEGDLQAAAEILKPLPLTPADSFLFVTQMQQFLLERRYGEAIIQLQAALENPAPTLGEGIARYYILLGLAQERLGDKESARATYLKGRDKLSALRESEDDSYELANSLALIHAGLGDKKAALEELDKVVKRWPENRPMIAVSEEVRAAINARFGDSNASLPALQKLLDTPYFYPTRKVPITSALLRVDPIWDPLRNDPRFQKLVVNLSPSSSHATAVDGPSDKSIAVLPFEDMSDDKANAYFAEGIKDEILDRLSKIADLKVISRSSTQKYKSAPDNLSEIGQELGVASILEGSVQRIASDAHIKVQLIKAATGERLWAQSYDRTLEHVFAVEAEVAQTVAEALKVTLLPAQVAKLRTPPTENAQAYDLFLKGEYEFHRAWVETAEFSGAATKAADYFRQATKLDPHFSLAYAAIARAELTEYYFRMQYGTERRKDLAEDARRNIDHSLGLTPDLATAHLALGEWHNWVNHDRSPAIEEFQRAIDLDPHLTNAITRMASVAMRRGQPERTIEQLRAALPINPREILIHRNLAAAFQMQRRYALAGESFAKALALNPNDLNDIINLAWNFRRIGDLEAAERVLESYPPAERSNHDFVETKLALLARKHDYQGMEDLVKKAPASAFTSEWSRLITMAEIAQGLGWDELARNSFAQARTAVIAAISKDPDQPETHQALASLNATLNHLEDAIREAQRALELSERADNFFAATASQASLAAVYAKLGRPDDAFPILTRLVSAPSGFEICAENLKHDSQWDRIRADPRFEKLVEEAKQPLAERVPAK